MEGEKGEGERQEDKRERKERWGFLPQATRKLAPHLYHLPADEMQQAGAGLGAHSKAPPRKKKGASGAGQGQQQVRREDR